MFNGMIQTILVAFSKKKSRSCTDKLSYENDAFNSQKLQKKHKQHVHHVHYSSRAHGTGNFLRIGLPLTRNMNTKLAVVLYHIFSKILKFWYW